MKHVKRFLDYVNEGITKVNGEYFFDWNADSSTDIMPLKYKKYRGRVSNLGDTKYSYYHAYQLKKNDDSTDLLKAVKMLEINKRDLDQLLNKAVIGFDKEFNISSFDTVISPTSSSLVLSDLVDLISKKGGIRNVFNGSFVKSAQDEIQLDIEKVEAVTSEKTKKDIMKAFKKATDITSAFKMKDVWAPHRKFFINFLKFNTDNDRRIYNAVSGKNIILIDDFKTSGTTIKEMIRQLAELGAANIVVFVLIKLE